MEDIKTAAKESYIRRGIVEAIETKVVERPRHTFLGSTDRKTYTIEILCQWMDQHFSTFAEMEPWQTEQKEIIDELVERAKHDFASQIIKRNLI